MRATLPTSSVLLSLLLSLASQAQDAPKVESDGAAKVDLTPSAVEPEAGDQSPSSRDSDGDKHVRTTRQNVDQIGAGPVSPRGVPESIKAMTDEEKRKLGGLLQDASAYLGGVRVQEAFEKLVEAEAMAPDYAAVHNLIGAAHTKVRNFDKAAAAFEKSVELDPSAFMSKFNLTEIHFVQHKWAQAQGEFEGLIKDNPKMPEGTKALIEFKILICLLKQDNETAAREILKKFDFLDDHPAFYFCNAAIHFAKEEEEEARGWMQSSERVFPAQQNSIYADSFIEVGWIENLQ